jgi:predicted nucleic acid binding AN1-type Zn finger protein
MHQKHACLPVQIKELLIKNEHILLQTCNLAKASKERSYKQSRCLALLIFELLIFDQHHHSQAVASAA